MLKRRPSKQSTPTRPGKSEITVPAFEPRQVSVESKSLPSLIHNSGSKGDTELVIHTNPISAQSPKLVTSNSDLLNGDQGTENPLAPSATQESELQSVLLTKEAKSLKLSADGYIKGNPFIH